MTRLNRFGSVMHAVVNGGGYPGGTNPPPKLSTPVGPSALGVPKDRLGPEDDGRPLPEPDGCPSVSSPTPANTSEKL